MKKDEKGNIAVWAAILIVAILVIAFVGPYVVQLIDTEPDPAYREGEVIFGPVGTTRGYSAMRFTTDVDTAFTFASFWIYIVRDDLGQHPPLSATCFVDGWIRQDGIFAGRRDVLQDFKQETIYVNVYHESHVSFDANTPKATIPAGTYLFELYVSQCQFSISHVVWVTSTINEGSSGDGIAALSDESGVGIYSVDTSQWQQVELFGWPVDGDDGDNGDNGEPGNGNQTNGNQTVEQVDTDGTNGNGTDFDEYWWLPYLIILFIVIIFILVVWAALRIMA